MADFSNIIGSVKKAATDAVNAAYPAALMFGEVISADPLKVSVEQKMTLERAQLILTRNVTDYFVDMTAEHVTELESAHIHAVIDTYTGGGTSQPTQHLHAYKGKKRLLVHNALKTGELVLLARVQGGQKFIILDRLEDSPDDTDGQWLA